MARADIGSRYGRFLQRRRTDHSDLGDVRTASVSISRDQCTIHEMLRRREMDLWSQNTTVVAWDRSTSWNIRFRKGRRWCLRMNTVQ